MNWLRWVLVRPTRDDYQYPDHYTDDAYIHALRMVVQPIQWRWPIAIAIRMWRHVRKDRP